MTGCQRYGAEIGAFVDGELDAGPRQLFEAHLPGCPDCRQGLTAYESLANAISELPALEPGSQFESRFWARVAREGDTERRRRGWLTRWPVLDLALGTATVAALALLVGLPDPVLPDRDLAIVSDAERFELLESDDLDVLAELDVLEGWDAPEGI